MDIEFLKNIFSPENTSIVYLYALCVLIITFGAVYYINKHKYKLWTTFGYSLAISLLYVIILLFIIPQFNKCDSNKYGILLPKFAGASNVENFGNENFNKTLSRNLKKKLSLLGLSDICDVKTISFIANDENEAKVLSERYNAKAFVYGDVAKLEKSISVQFNISSGLTNFVGVIYTKDSVIQYEYNAQVVYQIRHPIVFKDSKFNLGFVIDNIIKDLLFSIAANVNNDKKVMSEKILVEMPSVESRIESDGGNLKGFYYQQLAQAYTNRGKNEYAVKLYQKSYDEFEKIKIKLDNDTIIIGLDENKLRKFAGISMFKTAKIYLSKNDTLNAILFYGMAGLTDEVFINNIIELNKKYGHKYYDLESILEIIKKRSPFFLPRKKH